MATQPLPNVSSPTEVKGEDCRALPQAGTILLQRPQAQNRKVSEFTRLLHAEALPSGRSPSVARYGFSTDLSHGYAKHQSSEGIPTPSQYELPVQQHPVFSSTLNTTKFDKDGNSYLLSGAIPMEMQQLLVGAPLERISLQASMFNPRQYGVSPTSASSTIMQQPPSYSYNPNWKPDSSCSIRSAPFEVLDQTVAQPRQDNSVNGSYINSCDTTSCAALTDYFTPSIAHRSCGVSFDNSFDMNFTTSGSGCVTPGAHDSNFARLVDLNTWKEQTISEKDIYY